MVDPAPWAMAGCSSIEGDYPRRMRLPSSLHRAQPDCASSRPTDAAGRACCGSLLPLLAVLLLRPAFGGALEGASLPSGTILFSSSPFASLASEVEGTCSPSRRTGPALRT